MTETTETTTDNKQWLEKAAKRLIEQMDATDGEAVALLAKEHDHEECLALPMWSTLFKVNDGCDERAIKKLMCSLEPSDEDSADDLCDDHGIDVDKSEYFETSCNADECEGGTLYLEQDHPCKDYVCDECGAVCDTSEMELEDEDAYVEAVREAWADEGGEDYWLSASGWQAVGGTGVYAVEVYGDLYLGVNGCGYCFYDSHWIPLYLELGYGWHKQYEKEHNIGEAARDIYLSKPDSGAERDAIYRLRRAFDMEC